MNKIPRLFSYRRCPYAMRARMALVSAQIDCDVFEINFKNKPAEMLALSPKGTVPVLITLDGAILEESLDIMFWALRQNDPQNLLNDPKTLGKALIAENDTSFKAAVDRYKYASRFAQEEGVDARQMALIFLQKLDAILTETSQLAGPQISHIDIAIFPFIRQFANVHRAWFDQLDLIHLHNWLRAHVESDLFQDIFKKRDNSPYRLLA